MAKYRMPVLEDFSWQPPVIQMDLTEAPGAPSKGDRYIVAVGVPTGDDWFDHDNDIAWYDGAAWQFDIPEEGWYCYDKDGNILYHYNGAGWDADDISALEAAVSTNSDDISTNTGDIAALPTHEYVPEYGSIELTI